MKVLLITLALWCIAYTGYCQQERTFIDSVKPNIIYAVIKNISSDLLTKNKSKKLYCQIDVKQKMINGNGTDFNPEYQDTIFTIDTVQINLLAKKLTDLLKNISVELNEQSDIGKINRRNFIDNNVVRDKSNNNNNARPKENVYVNIKEPIDGWDIIQVLFNNFSKKTYGADINPCLTSNLYLPVIISYVEKEGKAVTQYFLYNYAIGINQKEGFYYKYVARTKLNICN